MFSFTFDVTYEKYVWNAQFISPFLSFLLAMNSIYQSACSLSLLHMQFVQWIMLPNGGFITAQ